MYVRKRKNTGYKRTTLRKKGTRRSKSSGGKLVTKNQLYRAIKRSSETKFASNQYNLAYFNSAVNSISDFITVLPPIPLGSTQAGRIGARINPIKIVIRGYVVYNAGGNSATQKAKMICARHFLFQEKTNKTYANISSANLNLLDLGGTVSKFDGYALSLQQPQNKDDFRFFYDKKYKMLKPWGLVNATTPSSSNDITGFDGSLYRPFTITLTEKHLPKTLIYDEAVSANYPVNFAPYMALGYSDLFDQSPDSTTTQIAMEFIATMHYKDA